LLFDRSPIGMCRTSEDGRFLHANPALVRMLGYDSVAELMAKNFVRDIYVDPEARKQLIAKYLPLGAVDGAIVRWRRKDSREIDVQLWGHVNEGEAVTFDVLVIDVTALEAAHADLRRAVMARDLVLNLVPGIYWRIDTDQRIVEVGGAMQEVLGYTGRGRYVGRTMADYQASEPPSVDASAAHARALTGETITFDSEYKDKMLSSTIAPLRDADGKILGAIGIAIDVTRPRQLERRMIDAQRAESLGVLAGGLAHDFNNLLVAVIGSAELALRELPPGVPGRHAIENIRDAGLRAGELTNQLLAYAGRGGAGTTRVYPGQLVDELLRIVATTMPKDVQVSVDIPAELALRGDPAQVRQVLHNLIHNARDAIGDRAGAIAIRGRLFQHGGDSDDVALAAPPGVYIALEVSDDGPGLDSEARRRVFEPFYTTKATGHGLGLAAVLGIVRAHGGGVRVRSEPGHGATFEILWPAVLGRAQTPPEPQTARTVLVVDDEDLVREVVARMIEDLGYIAVTARDGATALALIESRPIDAVLLDLTMPTMSGAEVIAQLRARRPGLPVVLCSGFDRDGKGPVKADAYLPKPFRIDALERTLAKVLPLRSV
jgi:two-component system cell cycle sensor histidine kinase/response regulator CckA